MSENQEAAYGGDGELAPEIEATEGNEEQSPVQEPEAAEQAAKGDEETEAAEDPAEEERQRKKRERRQRSKAEKRAKLEALEKIKGAASGEEPKEGDFEDYTEFVAAKAVWRLRSNDHQEKLKAAEAEAKAAEEAELLEINREWREQTAAASAKYPDFAEVVSNPDLYVSDDVASLVKRSDMGGDIAYHLGKNPAEAERLSEMHPLDAAREMGRIEARIQSASLRKKTAAPPPTETITGGAGMASPDPAKMTFAQYQAWRQGG